MRLKTALFCLTIALCGPLFLSEGCKTPPTASQAALSTLDGVGASVDATMKTAARLRAAGTITSDQWAKIADAHAKYLVAYNAAVDSAAVALDKASVPANVAALAADVLSLVATLNK